MDESHVKTIIFLLWNDRFARTSVLSIFTLALIVILSLSFLSGLLVLGAYIGGFIAFSSVFSQWQELPDIVAVVRGKAGMLKSQSQRCAVCGRGQCKRHQPATQQPWLGLDVPREIDTALEEFLDRTLQEFVYAWYKELSTDESFIQELKHAIRYSSSVLLRRILQVDVARVILYKLLPVGLRHLDDFLGSIRLAGGTQATSGILEDLDRAVLERAALRYLGPRLHPAVHSREAELMYLRQLTCLLLPQLVQQQQLNCRNFNVLIREILSGWVLLPTMDVLADPAIVNSLLLLLVDKQPLTQYPAVVPDTVPFLAHFVSSVAPPKHASALRFDMAGVLKDQSLLYPFIQFLKGVGSVNILQFCLDVEEFNRKMITPDLSDEDLENLYREAWDLYSVYFSPASPDHIEFSPSVVEEMFSILQEPARNIVKLRTTPPLFQAYEFAYSHLENTLGPLFHQSDDYFVLLCGQRLPSGFSKSGSSSPMQQGSPAKGRAFKKAAEGDTVAKVRSHLRKIKGALRAQPVEGHTFDNDALLDLGESEFAEELQLSEVSTYRDLSAWRISIPSVETQTDINSKSFPVFRIDVQRIDVREEDDPESYHWTVDRRYNDFYVLESKLTEFHGEFTDIHLPPKRVISGPRGVEFMESKRQVFEDFLQRLLQKPTLRGSDLLHAFLRSPSEFVPASVGVPEGLGRMIRRTVPIRLRKERGQHLDAFLATFLSTCETGKNRSSKYEWKDVNAKEPQKVRCLTHPVFGDNFGLDRHQPLFALAGAGMGGSALPIQGFYDCVLYLLVRVFGASQSVLRLALGVRSLCHNTINSLCCVYLDSKLRNLLVPPRVAHLIRLLQGAVFGHKGSSPTALELKARAAFTLSQLQSLLPGVLNSWLGSRYKDGILTIFTALQSPLLNKQLAYTLLDIVALELFPECLTGELSPQPMEK
ncbi:sorting nexin-14-like isoform X1 [Schistocerca cancellata]|uniref:sorting nexin-14-like isoform X1 n=1 Tax=Schistocerca cancellata TaxID=274614 RepID=UPI00211763C1|nr:sorting nexin-14-like isoform X1 [Schistocerca cancellata]